MKKITKKVAEDVLGGIDTEGFDYYFDDYTGEEFKGTELEIPVKEYREAYIKLHTLLETIREKFDIEVQ